MSVETMDSFVFNHTAQTDYPQQTPTQTKINLDARGEELRVKLNEVISEFLNYATLTEVNAIIAGQINTLDPITGYGYAIIIENGLLGVRRVT